LNKNKVDIPPKVIIIGNIAFDVNTFQNSNNKVIVNNGGACLYSAIPASLFTRVGIVSRVGYDFPIDILDNYNIDLKGLKIIKDSKTTRFHHTYLSLDGKNRTFFEEVYKDTIVNSNDIPNEWFNAKYIHIATNFPPIQLEIIKKVKANSNSIISVDTHEAYIDEYSEIIKEIFDMADIAFIDKDYNFLLNCNAPIKIIKCGKKGCTYIDKDKSFNIPAQAIENVVDKTGAGDCLTGVYLALLSKKCIEKYALKKGVEIATISIMDYGVEHLKDIRI
jgi:sugar/nucleoside kinase (ribokinase family)